MVHVWSSMEFVLRTVSTLSAELVGVQCGIPLKRPERIRTSLETTRSL